MKKGLRENEKVHSEVIAKVSARDYDYLHSDYLHSEVDGLEVCFKSSINSIRDVLGARVLRRSCPMTFTLQV